MTSNFIDQVLAGKESKDKIDDYVARWHDGQGDQSLHDYLGLTWDEYALWVKSPNTLDDILLARRRRKTTWGEDAVTAGPTVLLFMAGPLVAVAGWMLLLLADRSWRHSKHALKARHTTSAIILSLAILVTVFSNAIGRAVSPAGEIQMKNVTSSTAAYLTDPGKNQPNAIELRLVWTHEYRKAITSTFLSITNRGLLLGNHGLKEGFSRMNHIGTLLFCLDADAFGAAKQSRLKAQEMGLSVLGEMPVLMESQPYSVNLLLGPTN